MSEPYTQAENSPADAITQMIEVDYRTMSPLIRFGMCSEREAKNFPVYQEYSASILQSKRAPSIVSLGWAALEAATMLQDGEERNTYMATSTQRFEEVIKRTPAHPADREVQYEAKLGLLAQTAYTEAPESAAAENPRRYGALLSELLNDEDFAINAEKDGRSLISKVTIAGLASLDGYFILPASSRHAVPIKAGRPSFAHDLIAWKRPPLKLPARPDNYIQVKTRRRSGDLSKYGPSITLIQYKDVIDYPVADPVPGLLADRLNGKTLSDDNERILQRNAMRIGRILKYGIKSSGIPMRD